MPRDSHFRTMMSWLKPIEQTTLQGLKRLLRQPAFYLAATLTLALGIGASLAVFGVLQSVVLSPLPYPDADQLVQLQTIASKVADSEWNLAKGQFSYFRAENRSFQEMGLYSLRFSTLGAEETDGLPAEQLAIAEVSASMMETLEVSPEVGRTIQASDNLDETPSHVWLSHDLWTRRFGAESSVIGSRLFLDGQPVEIAGVLPLTAKVPVELISAEIDVDAWVPMWLDPTSPPEPRHLFRGIARLKPGVSLATAALDLDRLTASLPEALPQAYSDEMMESFGLSVRVRPLVETVVGDIADALWIVFGAVLLLLIVAFANVAHLVLARTLAREHELVLPAVKNRGSAAVRKRALGSV